MKRSHRIIFNFASIVFLSFLIILYGYRFIHFYIQEHKSYENKTILLYEKLIDSKGIDGTSEGLQKKDDMYIYASNSQDNYLYYAGRLWRIISIDKNNNIKLITNDIQTILSWNENFKESDINTWLNKSEVEHSGIFEKSLKDETNNLMKQNNLTSSLLTKKEYEILNNKNYLNNSYPYWIIDDNNKLLYVDIDGNIKENDEESKNYGIRPTIIIKSDNLYLSGHGTIDSPYIIKDNMPEKINGAYVGNYLEFAGAIWRIIDIDDNIKIVLDSTLDGEQIFSQKNNIYTEDNGIGQYLNDTYYNSLENNDYIIKNKFYNGSYGIHGTYSYLNKYESVVESNIGMLEIGDFFINEKENIYILTKYSNTSKTIFTINEKGNLYADYITESHKIRPVVYIDNELFIVGGKGTKEEPYKVGR